MIYLWDFQGKFRISNHFNNVVMTFLRFNWIKILQAITFKKIHLFHKKKVSEIVTNWDPPRLTIEVYFCIDLLIEIYFHIDLLVEVYFRIDLLMEVYFCIHSFGAWCIKRKKMHQIEHRLRGLRISASWRAKLRVPM